MDEGMLYRLRPTVRCIATHDSLQLVQTIPLKAVILHSAWKAVFDRLAQKGCITHREILALMPHGNPERVSRFMGDLIRKGYLSQQGVLPIRRLPFVSIIVPVRNRPKEIAACLESLFGLDYPRADTEIIVVDDASRDETPEIAARFPVRLISLKECRHAPSCRNAGAEAARGDILAFLDSDCTADPLWLKELLPAFEHADVGAVGGLVDSGGEEKGLDRYEEVKSSLKIGPWFRRSKKNDRFFYVPSCNLLTRRDLFLGLGGFHEDLLVGEDVDFCWRLEDAGYQVDYRPMGRVFHRHRNRVLSFCFRRFEYGTSEPLLQHRHRLRVKRLTLPPGACLFWGLIMLPLLSGSMIPFGLSWLTAMLDGGHRFISARKRNVSIGFISVMSAVLRDYAALLYHCCAFVSRYYLLWAIPFLAFAPLLSISIACAHLLTGVTDFFIKKPRLDPLSYMTYFSLEQLSYQLGVWQGCLRNLCFSPVNPVLTMRPRN